ncbi:hypothetical protein EJ05DRAFT_477257 [Pseudovirgaria hyperparasitica]|uniref:Uncharacterized protein n=1 Tax=Pseudovirgaria hyperparasitica TaxID=470096 RepID=A0A6A6W7H1_9PEZI|nr:uncharacterized protein EJ05DRAFT_477257 [Pseudovirgaria hyperparasitica]KAF2757031.1 hypothetical protein EJ05DRAFT_477257 [Pseudovirgaria hyperparasitica]
MRFEQSYLKSIEQAQGWQGVTYITIRDQVYTEDAQRSKCKLTADVRYFYLLYKAWAGN